MRVRDSASDVAYPLVFTSLRNILYCLRVLFAMSCVNHMLPSFSFFIC